MIGLSYKYEQKKNYTYPIINTSKKYIINLFIKFVQDTRLVKS